MNRFSQNIVFIIVFVLMFVVGFVGRDIYARYESNKLENARKQQSTDFVVSGELISNKAFRDWEATIKGTVKEKSKNEIIVESENKFVPLRIIPSITVNMYAFEVNSEGEKIIREASFEDILVGDKITAGVIFPDGQAEASQIIIEFQQDILSGDVISVGAEELVIETADNTQTIKLTSSTLVQRIDNSGSNAASATFKAGSISELIPGMKIIVEVMVRGNNIFEAQRIILRDTR